MSTTIPEAAAERAVSERQSEIEELRRLNAELREKLEAIYQRNARVELDKGWETSLTRFLCLTAITYLTMNLILWTIGGPFPPVHAIVPTCGYMLSTLSLPPVKRWWLSRRAKMNVGGTP